MNKAHSNRSKGGGQANLTISYSHNPHWNWETKKNFREGKFFHCLKSDEIKDICNWVIKVLWLEPMKSFCSSGDPRLPRSRAVGRGGHCSTPTTRAGDSQMSLLQPEKTIAFFNLTTLICDITSTYLWFYVQRSTISIFTKHISQRHRLFSLKVTPKINKLVPSLLNASKSYGGKESCNGAG